MAISRPFLLVLLGALLLGATAFAVQNARDASDDSSGGGATQQVAETAGEPQRRPDARPRPSPAAASLDSAKIDARIGFDQVGGGDRAST